MIEVYLKTLRKAHQRFVDLVEQTKEKSFEIPEGYKNSVFWNFGHALVIQESLLYNLTGNKSYFTDEIISRFKGGTEASSKVEVDTLKFFISSSSAILEKLENDLKSREKFKNFKSYYIKAFDIQLDSFEDALQFNLTHFSIHLGYAMSLRRSLEK